MKHVIDLSSGPAHLCIQNNLLCIRSAEKETTLPLREIGCVVMAHGQITCTQAAITHLALNGAALISCDERHLPAAMTMPLLGYHAPARRLAAQAAARLPARKRIWQQLVRAKLMAQAKLLIEVNGDDAGISAMVPQVSSGDSENMEGQAARLYWRKLFGPGFRRDFDAEDQNRYLNYGYAILRGIVSRAICAVGLHPGLGIHHHHRENPFCLADDLMEPLRPVVDRNVWTFVRLHGNQAPLDKLTKLHLLKIAEMRCVVAGESRSIFEVAEMMASSVAQVLEGQRQAMITPEPVHPTKQ